MRFHRTLTTGLAALMLVSVSMSALAQATEDARLGGGSDISSSVTVALPQGTSIPAIHYIFVDNPSDEPIAVQFRADAPDGITIQPEWQEQTVPAHSKITNYFGVEVSATTAAGEYPVVVQLVRSDIEAVPGQITNIPAIQTAFTVEVTGEASAVVVRGVSSLTGQPVSGTLVLAALSEDGRSFELNRLEGTVLETKVAPGDYRAFFLLGDLEVATEDFTVQDGEELEVNLEVETVAFVVAAIRPTEENGRLVVVDLVASVNNETPAIAGPASIQARITLDGTEVDLVVLRDMTELATGLTEASTQYRPVGGWQPGTYLFSFELTTPDFTLTAADQSSLEVPPNSGWDLAGLLASLTTREIIALAAAALLSILAIERATRLLLRRLRRSGPPPPENSPSRRERRSARRNNKKTPAAPTRVPASWLEERVVQPARVSPLTPASPVQPRNGVGHSRSHATHKGLETVTTRVPLPTSSSGSSSRTELSPVAVVSRTVDPRLANPASPDNSRNEHRGPVSKSRTIQHLHDQGILSPEWSVDDASLVYATVTSSAFRQALLAAGMTNEDYKKSTASLLRHGLVGRPPLAKRNRSA